MEHPDQALVRGLDFDLNMTKNIVLKHLVSVLGTEYTVSKRPEQPCPWEASRQGGHLRNCVI